jgi:hypothetical protein
VTLQNTTITATPVPIIYEPTNPVISGSGEMRIMAATQWNAPISTTATLTFGSNAFTTAAALGSGIIGWSASTIGGPGNGLPLGCGVNTYSGTTGTLNCTATTAGSVPVTFSDPACYLWYASEAPAPVYSTAYFAVANNQTCSNWSGPGPNDPAPVDLIGTGRFLSMAYWNQHVYETAVGYSTTATTTSGLYTITVASATGINYGAGIVGSGIPAGAVVTVIAGTTITMSLQATASASGVAVTFNGPGVGSSFMWRADVADVPLHGGYWSIQNGGAPIISQGANPYAAVASVGFVFNSETNNPTDANPDVYAFIEAWPASINTTGTTTAGSILMTVASAAGLTINQAVQAPGVPNLTLITGIAGLNITMSNPAAVAYSGAVSFSLYNTSDCIQESHATLSTLSALDTNKTTTCLFPGQDPEPIIDSQDNAIIVLYSVFGVNPATGLLDGSNFEGRAAYASLSSNLALPGSWTQGNFRMANSGLTINTNPGIPQQTPSSSDPSIAVVVGKQYPIIMEYFKDQWTMNQAYIPLTLHQFYLQLVGGTSLPTPSAQNDASNANNATYGVSPNATVPPGVPISYTYTVVKIPNGFDLCASANGCWQIVNPHDQTVSFLNGNLVAAVASTSQDVVIKALPSGTIMTYPRVQTLTACTGSGLSAITATFGTSVADDWFLPIPYDLTGAPGGTNFTPSNGNAFRSGALTSYGDTLVLGINTTGGNVADIGQGCQIAISFFTSTVQ